MDTEKLARFEELDALDSDYLLGTDEGQSELAKLETELFSN